MAEHAISKKLYTLTFSEKPFRETIKELRMIFAGESHLTGEPFITYQQMEALRMVASKHSRLNPILQ